MIREIGSLLIGLLLIAIIICSGIYALDRCRRVENPHDEMVIGGRRWVVVGIENSEEWGKSRVILNDGNDYRTALIDEDLIPKLILNQASKPFYTKFRTNR